MKSCKLCTAPRNRRTADQKRESCRLRYDRAKCRRSEAHRLSVIRRDRVEVQCVGVTIDVGIAGVNVGSELVEMCGERVEVLRVNHAVVIGVGKDREEAADFAAWIRA